MMIRMSDEDIKLNDSIRKWFAFNEKGRYELKADAPEEVRKIHETLKKKYAWLND